LKLVSEDASDFQKWYCRTVSASGQTQYGRRTILSLLKNAMLPVGRTLYVLGGGWNDGSYSGQNIDSEILGCRSSWLTFFNSNAGAAYIPALHQFEYGNGLDCSGYVHWIAYNTIYNTPGQGFQTVTSYDMADDFKNRGWAKTGDSNIYPGDIVSINEGNGAGHVYLVLGVCSDGSVLFAHSTLVPYGTQGAGVQLSGTSVPGQSTDFVTMDSEAARLAASYMKTHFPKWCYAPVEEPYNGYVTGNTVRATWITDGTSIMTDPENIRSLSGEQVIQRLFG